MQDNSLVEVDIAGDAQKASTPPEPLEGDATSKVAVVAMDAAMPTAPPLPFLAQQQCLEATEEAVTTPKASADSEVATKAAPLEVAEVSAPEAAAEAAAPTKGRSATKPVPLEVAEVSTPSENSVARLMVGASAEEPASPVPSLKQVGSMSSNVSQISSMTDMEETVDEVPLLSGWLSKKGTDFPWNWKPRYCLLMASSRTLVVYVPPDAAKDQADGAEGAARAPPRLEECVSKRSLPLLAVRPNPAEPAGLQFVCADRTVLARAADAAEAARWVWTAGCLLGGVSAVSPVSSEVRSAASMIGLAWEARDKAMFGACCAAGVALSILPTDAGGGGGVTAKGIDEVWAARNGMGRLGCICLDTAIALAEPSGTAESHRAILHAVEHEFPIGARDSGQPDSHSYVRFEMARAWAPGAPWLLTGVRRQPVWSRAAPSRQNSIDEEPSSGNPIMAARRSDEQLASDPSAAASEPLPSTKGTDALSTKGPVGSWIGMIGAFDYGCTLFDASRLDVPSAAAAFVRAWNVGDQDAYVALTVEDASVRMPALEVDAASRAAAWQARAALPAQYTHAQLHTLSSVMVDDAAAGGGVAPPPSKAGKCAPGEAFAGGGRAQLLGYVQMFATEDSEAGGQLACHMAVRMGFEQRLLPRSGGAATTAWQLVSFFGDVVWNLAGPLDCYATEGVALDGPCGADMHACGLIWVKAWEMADYSSLELLVSPDVVLRRPRGEVPHAGAGSGVLDVGSSSKSAEISEGSSGVLFHPRERQASNSMSPERRKAAIAAARMSKSDLHDHDDDHDADADDKEVVESRGRAALWSVRRHLGNSVGVLMVDSIRLTQPAQLSQPVGSAYKKQDEIGRFCCYLHELDLGAHDASGLPLQHTRLELGFRLSESGWEVASVRFDTLWRPQQAGAAHPRRARWATA